ncbi:uncharacterized protein PV07_08728 [Cladophialophora immunda]|uniref:Proteasome activator Blm10 middle HEAT repeats region domain-containing protein n=1 Tax=Cladophialophora immunda TaxID=569365 RepID=A0A0D1ZCV4_9EURO|nr:uncharacterized protein PV07_08728 [Cladophialophora immunda]KIW25561.1 hypothetical protein PV07_08728 [Cladophialophora immunda]
MTLHKKLDWEQMIERLKSPHLGLENNMVQGTFNAFEILFHAQALLDPQDRIAILQRLLPFVDTAHPNKHKGAQVANLISAMVPTAPAPESCPNCQPATIRPMLFKLFVMQNHGYQATANYVQLFSRFAASHLECEHVSFGPHGIFYDKEGGQSFHDPSILEFLPSDFREKRATLAGRITEWIVYSLSPMCETLQPSMLSGLESLIGSVCLLYHPEADPPDILFVSRLLYRVAYSFSLRYYREQTGELRTPPARRLSPELKEKFVLLLRCALFLGVFSLRMAQEDRYSFPISSLSHDSLQLLADLEPDLIVPKALKSFYVSQNSKVDGDAAYMSLYLLQQLSNIMVREKGLRCHAPSLMELTCAGIHPNNTKFTAVVARLVKTTICSFPWLPLAEKGNSDITVDAEHSMQWGNGEMERLYKAGSEVKVPYSEELSDHDESTLLRSATTRVPGFARQFLQKALGFLVQAYRSVDTRQNANFGLARRLGTRCWHVRLDERSLRMPSPAEPRSAQTSHARNCQKVLVDAFALSVELCGENS